MNNWHNFWRLSWFERRLLFQALFILPITGLALRLLGLKRCQTIMLRFSSLDRSLVKNHDAIFFSHAKKTARMVRVAASYGPYEGKCLERSLVLWFLLRRQGIKSELRIGARKENGQFEAHAWVELLGLPLNESKNVLQRFKPFEHAVMPLKEGYS